MTPLGAGVTSRPVQTERGTRVGVAVHGLETYGQDRTALEGGVLRLSLLFDDARRVAVTVYLLNQDPVQQAGGLAGDVVHGVVTEGVRRLLRKSAGSFRA